MIGTGWLVALTLLAVARLTHLIVDDLITDRLRELVRSHTDGYLSYFLGCPWCVSVWIAAVVAPIVYEWPHNPVVQIVVLGLAASETAGLLGRDDA